MPNGWSIHTPSGHCRHESGTEAYFDPTPTPSGALRVIGPYSNRPATELDGYLSRLQAILEDMHIGCYAVWGTLSKDHGALPITILGESCSWIPDFSERFRLEPDAAWPDWRYSADPAYLSHHSGISIFESDGGTFTTIYVDPDLDLHNPLQPIRNGSTIWDSLRASGLSG